MRIGCKVVYSNPGSPLKTTHRVKVHEDGSMELVEADVINTDDEIQSYAESCDLSLIIKRYMNGDLNALNRNNAMYGDFTNLPKTYAEFLQKRIDAEYAFNKLDIETKKNFDNDVNKFLAIAGEKEWFEKLGLIQEKVEENVKGDEVNE